MLKNKNIALGVTGSIAAFKACNLARLFVKNGANVKVVMSQNALKFVGALSFEAITSNAVLLDNNSNWQENALNHVSLSKWADAFVVAPCTANTLNKIANGIADNELTSTALCYGKNLFLAPAANTNMIQNVTTLQNKTKLLQNETNIIDPIVGELVCKDIGNGKMQDELEIFHRLSRHLLKNKFFANKTFIITGGGTKENIDDVRFIGNYSSQKMANALCTAAFYLGARVIFIHTKNAQNLPQKITKIKVNSAKQMQTAVENALNMVKNKASFNEDLSRDLGKDNLDLNADLNKDPNKDLTKNNLDLNQDLGRDNLDLNADLSQDLGQNKSDLNTDKSQNLDKNIFFFSIGAVSDYTPQKAFKGKLKKENLGENFSLDLSQTQDILAGVKGVVKIGFKAEFDAQNAAKNAQKMLSQKHLDLVCLNVLGDEINFNSDHTKFSLIGKDYKKETAKNTKLNVAFEILEHIRQKFDT